MRAYLYANTSARILTETQGGSAFTFPALTQGDSVVIGLPSFTVRREGAADVSKRILQGLRFAIGRRDARPTSGKIQFQVGNPATTPTEGTNLTAALDWNFSGAQLQNALNALSGKPATATVEELAGSYLVRWGALASYTVLTPRFNRLSPISVVDSLQYIRGQDYVTEIRLVQAPVAFADTFEALLGAAPSVTRVMAGGANGDVQWSEVQDLEIPSSFRGTLLLQRGSSKTEAITGETTAEELAELLNANLAATGELFEVQELPGTNRARIVFAGDLAGVAHSLLSVVVTESPPGDPTVTLQLTAPELNAVLRDARNGANAGEIKLPYELRCDLENELDDTETDVVCFQGEVVIKAKVILDAAALAGNLDWLRPPSPISFRPRGAGQIANGVRHWSGARGNGVATVFTIDHNLATDVPLVMVRRNVTAGAALVLGVDFSVTYGNDNTLTVGALGGWVTLPPAADEWLIAVLGMAGASQYAEHTHSIDEVEDLRDELDALGDSVSALQALVPSGSLGASVNANQTAILTIALPRFAEAAPAFRSDLLGGEGAEDYQALADIPRSALPQNGGLVPAVHDVAVETLTVPVPTPAESFVGRVFRNASASASVEIDGGFGRRGVVIGPGEFVACDGRSWYAVKRYDGSPTVTPKVFSAATSDVCTSTAHGFANGAGVMVSSAGVLPAPLLPEVQYFIRDVTTDTFKLAATSGGAAVDVTTAGTGVHSVFLSPKSTFYPVDFERELFILPISAAQFRIKTTLELQAGIETALVHVAAAAPRGGDLRFRDQRTFGQWSIVVRHGTFTSESAPATTGGNLKGIAWAAEPLLTHRINLVETPIVHTFGARIKRTADATFAVEKILYGQASASAAVVTSADLVLGAWLERFDTNDGVSDARGLALVMGLNRSNDEAETTGVLTLK